MRDFVEAGGDVALQHPLIRVGGQMVDLGDRVLGATSGAEPIATGLKVRLPDRLQHQLERGLHHAIPHGRDPQPAPLGRGAGLGDQPLPRLLNRQRGPRRAGIHRRPPSLPATLLRTCCRPSPGARLSRARTTTAAPSPPKAPSRRRACPPLAWLASGTGSPGRVPTFPTYRLTGAAPSFSPAASPHLRRRPSSWPPRQPVSPASESRCAGLARACAAARPISTRLEPVLALRGFDHWFSSAYTFPSC